MSVPANSGSWSIMLNRIVVDGPHSGLCAHNPHEKDNFYGKLYAT